MSSCALETSIPTKICVLVITSSLVAQPYMIRAQRPTQLFGLVQEKGMTTLAVARPPRTTDPTVYHARVDDESYHCRSRRKIQGPALFLRRSLISSVFTSPLPP